MIGLAWPCLPCLALSGLSGLVCHWSCVASVSSGLDLPGPGWTWDLSGLVLPCLALPGPVCLWARLDCPGLVWPGLAWPGLAWPGLAFSLAFSGFAALPAGLVSPCLPLDSGGLVWTCLGALSGLVWPCLAFSGLAWPWVDLSGPAWACLACMSGLAWPRWSCLRLFGFWTRLGLAGLGWHGDLDWNCAVGLTGVCLLDFASPDLAWTCLVLPGLAWPRLALA